MTKKLRFEPRARNTDNPLHPGEWIVSRVWAKSGGKDRIGVVEFNRRHVKYFFKVGLGSDVVLDSEELLAVAEFLTTATENLRQLRAKAKLGSPEESDLLP